MRYVLDTDTINYLLKEIQPVPHRFRAVLLARAELILCPLVHYEVTRYLKLKGARRIARGYARLIEEWTRVDFAGEDWDLAADLWAQRHRAGRPIEDYDLLIAV